MKRLFGNLMPSEVIAAVFILVLFTINLVWTIEEWRKGDYFGFAIGVCAIVVALRAMYLLYRLISHRRWIEMQRDVLRGMWSQRGNQQ